MHDDAVYDCRQRLDHGVELRGAETDAAPVERRITAAGDGARPLLADGDPVAVAPYARNLLEVGSAITRSILVAPKPHRHGGHRLGDDEFAEAAHDGLQVFAVRLDGYTEHPARDFARIDRHAGGCADERRAHIRAAGRGTEQSGVTDGLVD